MRCSEAEKLIPKYIDGELEEQRSRELAEHIAGCSSCTALEKQLTAMGAVLASWQDVEPKLGFDRLQARLEQGAPERRPRFEWLVPVPKWASAALAVASVAVGVVMGLGAPNSAPAEPPTQQQVVSALGLHPYDDILDASIAYAADESPSDAVEGGAQ